LPDFLAQPIRREEKFGPSSKLATFEQKYKLSKRTTGRLASSYSARKAITLIVKVANAGGAHMILVVFTVCLLLSA
jgi:hypothetical protein